LNAKTPVTFIIFNRPDTTEKVFEEIRRARPPKLLVVADGPRSDRPGEAEKCAAARAIIEQVDWPCEVLKNYSETNLGCKQRVSSGLDWVFQTVEEAIILEDDCLPHPTFFKYCEELLTFYRANPQVMHISGDNFLFGKEASRESYYFSKYAHVWGWATWRRAWTLFQKWDLDHPQPDLSIFRSNSEKKFWSKIYQQVRSNDLKYTWDYQWSLVCMAYRSVCVMPNANLVSNIGFGITATNTKEDSNLANIPAHGMEFPLIHAKTLEWNNKADEQVARLYFYAPSHSILKKIKSVLVDWI